MCVRMTRNSPSPVCNVSSLPDTCCHAQPTDLLITVLPPNNSDGIPTEAPCGSIGLP